MPHLPPVRSPPPAARRISDVRTAAAAAASTRGSAGTKAASKASGNPATNRRCGTATHPRRGTGSGRCSTEAAGPSPAPTRGGGSGSVSIPRRKSVRRPACGTGRSSGTVPRPAVPRRPFARAGVQPPPVQSARSARCPVPGSVRAAAPDAAEPRSACAMHAVRRDAGVGTGCVSNWRWIRGSSAGRFLRGHGAPTRAGLPGFPCFETWVAREDERIARRR